MCHLIAVDDVKVMDNVWVPMFYVMDKHTGTALFNVARLIPGTGRDSRYVVHKSTRVRNETTHPHNFEKLNHWTFPLPPNMTINIGINGFGRIGR